MPTTHLSEHQELLRVIRWIQEHASGIALPADERSLIVTGCFDVTIESQAAIAQLYQVQLYGPMFALMRVLTEALFRGLWFHVCATNEEIAKFKKGKLEKSFAEMVNAVEVALNGNALLSRIKATSWRAYYDFTHTGFLQITRCHKPGRIESNYPDHELRHTQYVASALGLLAAAILAGMSREEGLGARVYARVSES